MYRPEQKCPGFRATLLKYPLPPYNEHTCFHFEAHYYPLSVRKFSGSREAEDLYDKDYKTGFSWLFLEAIFYPGPSLNPSDYYGSHRGNYS